MSVEQLNNQLREAVERRQQAGVHSLKDLPAVSPSSPPQLGGEPRTVNPKEECGAKKTPMHLIPPAMERYLAAAMGHGAAKYGAWNFRSTKIALSTYVGAMRRHTSAIAGGEWIDPESGLPHAAHLAANAAILLDSWENRMLVDDLPASGCESPQAQQCAQPARRPIPAGEQCEEASRPVPTGEQRDEEWRRVVLDGLRKEALQKRNRETQLLREALRVSNNRTVALLDEVSDLKNALAVFRKAALAHEAAKQDRWWPRLFGWLFAK